MSPTRTIDCVLCRVLLLHVGVDRTVTMHVIRRHQKWLQYGDLKRLVDSVPCVVAEFQGWQEADAEAMVLELEAVGAISVVLPVYDWVDVSPPGSFVVNQGGQDV